MVDKNFCMSSYLAFRYIEREDTEFFAGLHHKNFVPVKDKIKVSSAQEIDAAIEQNFDKVRGKKLGLMLSGGMDSAILASYMTGSDAYTFTAMQWGGCMMTNLRVRNITPKLTA